MQFRLDWIISDYNDRYLKSHKIKIIQINLSSLKLRTLKKESFQKTHILGILKGRFEADL